MTLYQLPHEIERLNALIDANGGEVSPEIEAELTACEKLVAEKADDYAAWIRQLKADAEQAKAEANLFASRKRSRESLAARVTSLVLNGMKAIGVDKLKGRFVLSARNAGTPSIRWVGPGPIPKAYERTTVEFDGAKALEDYRAGRLPKEGFSVTFSQWLDIR